MPFCPWCNGWMNTDWAYKLYICPCCKKTVSYDLAVIKLMDFLGELSEIEKNFLASVINPIPDVLQGVLHPKNPKITIIHHTQKSLVLQSRISTCKVSKVSDGVDPNSEYL